MRSTALQQRAVILGVAPGPGAAVELGVQVAPEAAVEPVVQAELEAVVVGVGMMV